MKHLFQRWLVVINAFWQRGLTYRATILAYRVGEITSVLIIVLMWSLIYKGTGVIRGYTLPEMITYVFIGALFSDITRNWLVQRVATDIKEGKLSMFLVRPMSYLEYALASDIGRTSLPLIMSVVTQCIVILFFLDRFIINTDPVELLVIIGILALAFVSELLMSFIIGLIAFWTDEVDGIFATVSSIKNFLSGSLFPLALLPTFFAKLCLFFPFAYSAFVPTQIYLGKFDIQVGIIGFAVQICWVALLYLIARIVWARGLRRYEGVGV